MKKRKPGKKTAPKARNPYALHAKKRSAGAMKDRRTPRGGAKNEQRDYKEEEI